LAADRNKLAERVKAAELELAGQGEVLDAFFAVGLPKEGETRRTDQDFMRELQAWTAGVSALLPPSVGLLFQVLCNLEAVDRKRVILDSVWKNILTQYSLISEEGRGRENPPPDLSAIAVSGDKPRNPPQPPFEKGGQGGFPVGVSGESTDPMLPQSELGLPSALDILARVGLLGIEAPPELDTSAQNTTYTIHPGVAEATRAATNPELKTATDSVLGDYFIALHRHGLKTEMEGGGATVVDAARRATPYLLRRERWEEAATLLERMLQRDQSPETLAYALPLLRRIVEATADTPEGLENAGLLARLLSDAGRFQEAEPLLRGLIKRSVDRGEYRTASAVAGDLLTLLGQHGRLDDSNSHFDEVTRFPASGVAVS